PFEAGSAVKRFEIGTERLDYGAVAPIGSVRKPPETGGSFENFPDTFPGLVADKTAQFEVRGDVIGIVENVLPEDAHEPCAVHVRGEDQEDEMAFGAFPAPQRAIMSR